jgi:hypothetical protein
MSHCTQPGRKLLKRASKLMFLAATGILFYALAQPEQTVRGKPSSQAVWPNISLTQVAGGLNAPDYLTNAGDNSGRIFVVEQSGVIRIVHNGNLLTKPFLDISDRVRFNGEEGLLSLAFPPDYNQKGYFYIYYTRKGETNNQVSRFHLSSDPNMADRLIPTTMEACSPSDRMGTFISARATVAAVATHFETPRTLVHCWASSCASIPSTPGDKRQQAVTCSSYLFCSTKTRWLPAPVTKFPPTIPLSVKAAHVPKFGRLACATHGATHSTARPTICTSPTSARTPGKRSIFNPPAAWVE